MRRHIPTTSMMLCFEAAARLGSFSRAADHLSLSQSAISHSINGLEAFLGITLFERNRQRVSLTEAGRLYATSVASILERLESETALVIARSQDDPVLRLATYPTFGSRWLMPRLPQFTELNPGIELSFTTGVNPFSVHAGDLDIAVQHGVGTWPETRCVRICDESLVVVAAPSLVGTDLCAPHEIERFIRLSLRTRSTDWGVWFEYHDLPHHSGHSGPVFETFGLMIGAARSGLGVALVPSLYVEEELRLGRLCAPFGPPIASDSAFFAVCDERRAHEEKICRFMDWIATNAEAPNAASSEGSQ